MAFWFEDGVVSKSFGTTPSRFNETFALAFHQVFLAILNQANNCAELRRSGFLGRSSDAVELGEELRHVGFGVAVGAGVTCAQHAGRPFEGLNLQARVVRKAIEPVVGDDVAGFDLSIAFERGGIFDDLLVTTDVGQALDAVPVAKHFLELAHLVGVVRREHENRPLVVFEVAHDGVGD